MCGRYYIEIDDSELEEIVREAEKRVKDYPGHPGQITLKTAGEIFPTDTVPVLTGVGRCEPMKWGFVNFKGRPVINARGETALERPMFRQAMLQRRCLIPASGYYEWRAEGRVEDRAGEGKSRKVKYRFRLPDGAMYFAGCFRQEQGSPFPHFVILTRQASEGVAAIHDRMPVILPAAFAQGWFHGEPDISAAVDDLIYSAV